MKQKVLAGLLGAALATGGMLGAAKLKDLGLNKVKYSEFPTCLAESDGSGGYAILSADEEANTYSGVKVIAVFQMEFRNMPARLINERNTLKQVDCRTGEPVGK